VRDPGSIYELGKIAFRSRGGFLRMRLPSGRVLFYPNPRVEQRTDKYDREKTVVLYDGQDTKVGSPGYGKWGPLNGYGGKWTENAVQALARDVMVQGMFNVEKAGYEVRFTVHDECVAEVPAGFGDVKAFEDLLCQLPTWADGLPLKAAGYRSVRYKKD
jgi:DNA polymerase